MKYTVTSFSENEKTDGAQITVTVGEGSERRSFTRHLVRRNGALIGLNIDERAIPLNELYEAELATAEANLASAKATFKKILAQREAIMDVPEEDHVAKKETGAKLEAELEAAALVTAVLETVVDDAETKLAIVRRELPLMMEFYH